jgi:hypothetical protein
MAAVVSREARLLRDVCALMLAEGKPGPEVVVVVPSNDRGTRRRRAYGPQP